MVTLEIAEGGITVKCPYSKRFTDFAHMRNGVWSDGSKQWLFDRRDEYAVRATLIDIYGTDDYEHCDKCDVRVNLDDFNTDTSRVFVMGRELLYRKFFDRDVRLGEDVVLIQGQFKNNPRNTSCVAEEGTILEVRGVPRTAAEKTFAKHPDNVIILGGIDKEALCAEKERLLKRIEEIEELLNRPSEDEYAVIADLED